MFKNRIITVLVLLILSIYLGADTNSNTVKAKTIKSAYPLSSETVSIQGFSKYPNTVFYHVYAKSLRKIIITQINGNAITVQSDRSGFIHYISWDTALAGLEQGVELSGEENPGIIQYLRLYRTDFKPKALEIPFYPPCRKITHITSSFSITRHPSGSANSGREFGLNINKRVYTGGANQVTITDKFSDMQVLIEKLTHKTEKTPAIVLSAEEARLIRAYADSLKYCNLKSLEIFKKNPTIIQEKNTKDNIDKPHGILKLQVYGFEKFEDEIFYLIIVGGDGIICRRIRGNSVRFDLDSDEKAFISRSKYWKREKKGVLFDTSSKEYTHFKSVLHSKNKYEEELIRIPIQLINEENKSKVYRFYVENQLPELTKFKGECIIKYQQQDGKDILEQSLAFWTLKEGYNHSGWSRYIMTFLLVLIVSVVIEYLVMLVILKPFCYKSGWDNKLLLFYTCLGGTFITLAAVWFLIPFIKNLAFIKLVISFAFTIIAESIIYMKYLRIPIKKTVLISFCCNLVSYAAIILMLI